MVKARPPARMIRARARRRASHGRRSETTNGKRREKAKEEQKMIG